MDFNRAKEAYAYQIERQLVQTKGRILEAFRTLEEEIVNLGELTYFDAKTQVELQTVIARLKSEYLETIGDLPMRTLETEVNEEID